MSSNVNVANHIAPVFDEMFFDIMDHKHTHYVFKGGRGSTKSSFIAIMIPLLLMQNEDSHAVCLRKVGETLKDSVYANILWGIEQLGVSHLFKATVRPLEITYIKTGQKILFRGLDKKEKIKGIKLPFGRISIVWWEEWDQFSGMEEVRNVNQSLIRADGDNWLFYAFNPPISKNNWTNEEVLIEREDRVIFHSTYLDVPKEWLGSQFWAEAEHLKRTKELAYKHEYLGEATGTGGDVFNNLVLRTITDEEIQTMDQFLYGVDYGFAVDPASWGKFFYHNNKLWIVDEIYEVGLSNKQLTEKIKAKGVTREPITADSSEPKSISEMKDYGLNMQKAKKGPDSREFTYKFLQSLDEIIIDRNRTPNACREFSGYEYDRNKDGQFISRYPDGNDHFIDCCRYATEHIARNKKKSNFSGRRL